jgi:ABC-type antimicrobial peptide transport system permease subunit
MVISASMARRLWQDADPLGRCLRVGADTAPCRTVVGVAEDIKELSLTSDAGLHYYLPLDQFPTPRYPELLIRVRGEGAREVETVRKQLQPLMPPGSWVTVTPMRDMLDQQQQLWRTGATMFLWFGGLAVTLASFGLYSVIAYGVAQRKQELGVRVALGAASADLLRLVVSEGVRYAFAGVAIGSAVALAAGRWAQPLLFAVSSHDPGIFGAVIALLLLAAVAASSVPAMRAARIDPVGAIRTD